MEIIEKMLRNDECTACTACVTICPTKSIKMEYNKEGFKYPKLNKELCIKCMNCIKICPIYNREKKMNSLNLIIEGYSCNVKEVEEGSSGGIFPLLSKKLLKEKGIIYGAVFNEKLKEIEYKSSKDVNIEKIFKSKYVQSNLNESFQIIERQLIEGEKVLFSGTPCHIEGLKKYLRKEYSNLITIDFKCHGVPSPQIFKKWLMLYEKKQNSKIIDCSFREKDYGWEKQVIKLYFQNKKILKIRSNLSTYYNLFTRNYILRKSCYNCQLYKNHYSDITLADAWESKINPRGVSKVFIHTEKGKNLMLKIKNNIKIEKNISMESKEKYCHQYSLKNRMFYFKYYEKIPFKLLLEICRIKIFIERLFNKIKIVRSVNEF